MLVRVYECSGTRSIELQDRNYDRVQPCAVIIIIMILNMDSEHASPIPLVAYTCHDSDLRESCR